MEGYQTREFWCPHCTPQDPDHPVLMVFASNEIHGDFFLCGKCGNMWKVVGAAMRPFVGFIPTSGQPFTD